MLDLLWLQVAAPLLGSALLLLVGGRLGRRAVAALGTGSVAVALGVAAAAGIAWLGAGPQAAPHRQVLWSWLETGGLAVDFALRLDALSLVMTLVVTGVGLLIHLYAAESMREDAGYARFFGYLNLFVAAMLVLVLADDLLTLYVGWEGVGLCSYLLIGFWYADPANGRAARKAFVVTRLGDAALALGLCLIFAELGTLRLDEVLARAPATWVVGGGAATAAAALLLAGAAGKSAQLPLQVWLPDAMAGPTPVSALIHAATMVTAGVYLLARAHALLLLAPAVMQVVAVIGAATLLVAGCSALAQWDLKRVLAWSTISQLGYMFLAVGVGAWTAAIFHLVVHASVKALLFLAAGAAIDGLHHEQDLRRMGGLRRRLPVTHATFLIAAASLAGLPVVTAGFFSKEAVLHGALAAPWAGSWLWSVGLAGAALTALYIFRAYFLVFGGPAHAGDVPTPGWRIRLPLVVLAALSLGSGWLETPSNLGGVHVLGDLLASVLPAAHDGDPSGGVASPGPFAQQAAATVAFLLGLVVAERLHRRRRPAPDATTDPVLTAWRRGWGFDALYAALVTRPYTWFAHTGRGDVFGSPYAGVVRVVRGTHALLRATQDGRLRRYAAGLALGAVAILAGVMWL